MFTIFDEILDKIETGLKCSNGWQYLVEALGVSNIVL